MYKIYFAKAIVLEDDNVLDMFFPTAKKAYEYGLSRWGSGSYNVAWFVISFEPVASLKSLFGSKLELFNQSLFYVRIEDERVTLYKKDEWIRVQTIKGV